LFFLDLFDDDDDDGFVVHSGPEWNSIARKTMNAKKQTVPITWYNYGGKEEELINNV